MLRYIIRRIITMIPMFFVISIIIFYIIQLPPGDFISHYTAQMESDNEAYTMDTVEKLREQYGLDKPWYVQYYKWMKNIITKWDFGYSFTYNKSVTTVIRGRMALTIFISLVTMAFVYIVSIPIGIYSAVRQYSFGDYVASIIGFLGSATPNFLLAIILMYISFKYFGDPMLGVVSPEYVGAPWSFAKGIDMLKHLVIPIVVIGTAGTCGLIRTMRAQMLDQIDQQYVLTARSKGVKEKWLLYKYCVRAAINPIVATIGWSLAGIFGGSTITAIVLNLPTQGPVMYAALRNQDMYLAGTWLLFMACMTVIGTLISDILLAWLDPRIRIDGKGM